MPFKKAWKNQIYFKTCIIIRLAEIEEFHVDISRNNISDDALEIFEQLLRLPYDNADSLYFEKLKRIVQKFMIYWQECTREVNLYNEDSTLANKENIKMLVEISKGNNLERQERFLRNISSIKGYSDEQFYHLLGIIDRRTNELDVHYADFYKSVQFEPERRFARLFKILLAECKAWMQRVFDDVAECFAVFLQLMIPRIDNTLNLIIRESGVTVKRLESEMKTKMDKIRNELYERNKTKIQLMRAMPRVDENAITEQDYVIPKLQAALAKLSKCKPQVLTDHETKSKQHEEILEQLKFINEELERREKNWMIIEELQVNTWEDFKLKRKSIGELEEYTDGEKLFMLELLDRKLHEFQMECRRELLNLHISHISTKKLLLMLFWVEGANHWTSCDDMREFFTNEFGRKVFIKSDTLEESVYKCDGSLRKLSSISEVENYCLSGRYIERGDQKLYRRSECSSMYHLSIDGLMTKVILDCGHELKQPSSELDPTCVAKIETKESEKRKATLTEDDMSFIWDSMGSILMKSIAEVCQIDPSDHSYMLGHKLLKNRFESAQDPKTATAKIDEGKQYRIDRAKQRELDREKARQEWLDTQVMKETIKPDDAYEMQLAKHAHIMKISKATILENILYRAQNKFIAQVQVTRSQK